MLIDLLVRNKRKNRLYRYVPPKVLVPAATLVSALTREPELRLLRRLVPRDKISLDIGANRGVYTWALALLSERVFAYEPNPSLCERLRALGLRNVDIRQIALSDRSGEAELVIPEQDGVELDSRASLSSVESGRRIVVPTRKLDEMEHEHVGFVKIDVEGHEEAVLAGAEGLLRRERPNLIVEIEQRFLTRDMREVIRWIEELGYRGAYLHEGVLHPIERFSVEQHQLSLLPDVLHRDYVNNFIFRPR